MQKPAPFSNPKLYNDYYTYDYHIPADLKTTLSVGKKVTDGLLTKSGGGLTFKSREGYTLRPLYDIHHQRYVVYWDLK